MILLKDFKNDLKQTEFGPETGYTEIRLQKCHKSFNCTAFISDNKLIFSKHNLSIYTMGVGTAYSPRQPEPISVLVEFLTLPNENNINIKIKFNCTPCETDLERSPKYIYSVCY